MRTTISLDDEVMKDVMRFGRTKKPVEAIRRALAEFVRQQKINEFIRLAERGEFQMDSGYDLMAVRRASAEAAVRLER